MARSFWDFYAKDTAGNVVANAKVYLYAQGTGAATDPPSGTAITGSVYSAATGGSALTFPRTTDTNGKVTLWFATAQNLDVVMTDNSGTAYKPSVGAATVSFDPRLVTSSVSENAANLATDAEVTAAVAASAATLTLKPTADLDQVAYVTADGDDTNDGLSWRSAFATAQHAIDFVTGIDVRGRGGKVRVGPGQFHLIAGVIQPGHCKVIGAGSQPGSVYQGGTEFIWDGTSGDAWNTAVDEDTDWSHGVLQGVYIKKGTGTGTGVGLRVRNPQNASLVEDVLVSGFATNQILVEETKTVPVGDVPGFYRMERVWALGGTEPFVVKGGVQQGVFDSCAVDADATTTTMFSIKPGLFPSEATRNPLTLIGVKVESNDADCHGFDVSSLNPVNFIGCYAHRFPSDTGTKAAFRHSGSSAHKINILGGASIGMDKWFEDTQASTSIAPTSQTSSFARSLGKHSWLEFGTDDHHAQIHAAAHAIGGADALSAHDYTDHAIGSARITSGLDADKPASGSGATADRLYWAYDTQILYRDDNTNIVEMARAEGATRLASLATKPHSALTSVTADQHHAQAHAVSGADHTGILDLSQVPTSIGRTVRRTGDSAGKQNNTLANDDTLLFAVLANEVWFVEGFLLFSGSSATHDAKLAWSVPSGCAVTWGGVGAPTQNSNWGVASAASAIFGTLAAAGVLSVGSISGTFGVPILATVAVSTTAGNVNLQWAQDVTEAVDLKLLKNAFLRLTRLG